MKRLPKQVRAWIEDNWRVTTVVLLGVGAVSTLLFFRLGSLVGGLSANEFVLQQTLATNSLTLGQLLHNPLYLPYYVAQFIIQLGPVHGPTAVRSVGVLFGILGSIGFFYILRKWYTLRMAIFGTVLFATSSWFLHTARYAAPESSYLLLPVLIAGMVHIQAKARTHTILLLVTLLGLLSLYIPGMIWFLIAALILERRIIIRSVKLQPVWFVVGLSLMTLVLLAPLVTMLVSPLAGMTTMGNLKALLGLPAEFGSLGTYLSNAGHLLANIFAYNTQGNLYVPGHLPWLDASTGALVLIGMYRFAIHFRLDRSKLIALVGVLGAVLITLGGLVSIVLLLPFIYLLAVEALKWLLDLWLSIFPRNPLARSFGIGMIVVLIGITSIYHLERYYYAWGHAPETRAVFNKLP